MNDELSPALRALRELMDSGGWRDLPGPPNTVIIIHPWPDGSVDTLAIRTETHALVERTNPAGTPVWRQTGSVTEVIDALRQIPPPFAPDIPGQALENTPSRDRDLGPL